MFELKMKFFTLLLSSIFLFVACGQQTANTNTKTQEQFDRESDFTNFQAYIDKNYPNWKVKGVRKDEETPDDILTKKAYYYLLLNDGKTDQVVFVVKSDFQKIDGEIETHIYEPSEEALQKCREYQLKDKEAEKPDFEPNN